MAGSNLFSLETTDNFDRSFRKLGKSYKSKSQQTEFANIVSDYISRIVDNPYLSESRDEPLSGLKIPEGWTFQKLAFTIAKGASGQIRLMYLVNEDMGIVRILWIYTHEQFAKRPSNKDLKDVIVEAFPEDDCIDINNIF